MGYSHKGIAIENGKTEYRILPEGSPELLILPVDDALHIQDPVKGDFEWWYFDVFEARSEIFVKIVFHIGTDPLRTRVYPQLAVSVNIAGVSGSFTRTYRPDEISSSISSCDISADPGIRIRSVQGKTLRYTLDISLKEFRCSLTFTSITEGWKPLGNSVFHQWGRRKSEFAWTIPVPEARVTGELEYKNRVLSLSGATGYHDHNYIKVDREHPLHLDNLVTEWIWGKCYAGRFTLIFMDTRFRSGRITSVMLAEHHRIIHSSNNLLNLRVHSKDYDRTLKAGYPRKLIMELREKDLRFDLVLDAETKADKRDLLEGVNPFMSWLIKTFLARPVYFSLIAKARLGKDGEKLTGSGNYEVMRFRG